AVRGGGMSDALCKDTLGPLVLRAGLSLIFVYHGLDKIVPAPKAWGGAWMSEAAQPALVQFAVAWGELAAGLAFALGLLTRLAAAGMTFIMVAAIYLVHWPFGFDLRNRGFEYNLAVLVLCLATLLFGGGTLAVDNYLPRLWKTQPVPRGGP